MIRKLSYVRHVMIFTATASALFFVVLTNADGSTSKVKLILADAQSQVGVTRGYDPAYRKINYPNGDVPRETGVCTDVVIRAWRTIGIDLQKEVHEDMTRAFKAYPNNWGMLKPDSNIDHRRVPNLMKYFQRKGKSLAVRAEPKGNDFKPGDIITWDLGTGQTHIGIVSSETSNESNSKQPLIFHNIGAGAQHEDVLFRWKIIGHYRYF